MNSIDWSKFEPFANIPTEILAQGRKLVFFLICQSMSEKKKSYISNDEVGECLGMTGDAAGKVIKHLKEAKIIDTYVDRNKQTNAVKYRSIWLLKLGEEILFKANGAARQNGVDPSRQNGVSIVPIQRALNVDWESARKQLRKKQRKERPPLSELERETVDRYKRQGRELPAKLRGRS
jgi:hypothetical protein